VFGCVCVGGGGGEGGGVKLVCGGWGGGVGGGAGRTWALLWEGCATGVMVLVLASLASMAQCVMSLRVL
jgi:hypothetical protein